MLKKVRLQPALANSFGTLALVTLLLLALSPKLFAAGEECMHRLASGQAGKPVVSSKAEPEVIPSGRDSDLFQTFQKNVKEILGPNGIAARLGLAVPPHQVEFVPAGELSLLATLGRHAIGHWVDGSQLAQKVYENTGVLEFVTPGCPTCRSFYSDTTSYEHQLSILFHVAGHNDFSVNSTMFRKRNADPIMESLKFYDKVENYYALYGHDEVSRWYQYLESLMYMQDLSRGSFDHPSTFVRPSDAENTPATRMPASPTKSILQAMIENLPAGTPSWKKEMLISFEAMNRVYGAYATTKIMNEGWATLMQEIIAGHSEFVSAHNNVEWADLLSGVAVPRLSNPYFMGREAWRRVRARFNARPEIKLLNPFERDKKFIEFAHTIIAQMNDYDFLKFALDETWVRENKFILQRKATPTETDWSLPREKPDDQIQYVTVSNDPKRVVEKIAHKLADKELMIPQIYIENFNAFGRGVVSFNHQVFDDTPLKKGSLAQTLYVLSQVFTRTVSLKTSMLAKTMRQPTIEEYYMKHWGFVPEWVRTENWLPPLEISYELVPARVEVSANGKTEVFRRNPKTNTEELDEANTKILQAWVDGFREEQEIMYFSSGKHEEDYRFGPYVETLVHRNLEPGMRVLNHAPTAAKALLEYQNAISQLLPRRLRLLMEGKIASRTTSKGVMIGVLPRIPHFELDHKGKEKIWEKDHPSPIDPALRKAAMTVKPPQMVKMLLPPRAKGDRDVDLGQGDKNPGDKEWGPDPKRNKGEGEGDGDEDDGDSEDGENPGKGRRPGRGDAGVITIPFDLYGKMLEEYLELPNLRPKSGESENTERVREGGIRKPQGDTLWTRMMPEILARGRQALLKQGIKNPTRDQMLREGMRYVQPTDYIVNDHDVVPLPDVNAIVVFTRDMSGSMSGRPNEVVRDFMFYLKMLLLRKYKNVQFRYVGFSGTAREFKTEQEFFSSFIGGGTDYSTGVELAGKILTQYPPGQWDRFMFTAGDAEDGTPAETAKMLEKWTPEIQYNAFIHSIVYGEWGGELVEKVKRMAEDDSSFGYVTIDGEEDAPIKAIRKLFGKDRVKKGE